MLDVIEYIDEKINVVDEIDEYEYKIIFLELMYIILDDDDELDWTDIEYDDVDDDEIEIVIRDVMQHFIDDDDELD